MPGSLIAALSTQGELVPIGEIAGELLGGVFRLLGNIFIEIVVEILIRGLGYCVCRPFSKYVDPDGYLVLFIGLLAWIVIFFIMYSAYNYFSIQIEIDRCLDMGGSYNYEQDICKT